MSEQINIEVEVPSPDPDRWALEFTHRVAKEAFVTALSQYGMKAIRDGVIVERLDMPERTRSGIWIPKVAQHPMQMGRVVAIGLSMVDDDGNPSGPCCNVGDVVLYTGAWQGEDFEHEGRRCRKLDNFQVAAIVEDWNGEAIDVRHE